MVGDLWRGTCAGRPHPERSRQGVAADGAVAGFGMCPRESRWKRARSAQGGALAATQIVVRAREAPNSSRSTTPGTRTWNENRDGAKSTGAESKRGPAGDSMNQPPPASRNVSRGQVITGTAARGSEAAGAKRAGQSKPRTEELRALFGESRTARQIGGRDGRRDGLAATRRFRRSLPIARFRLSRPGNILCGTSGQCFSPAIGCLVGEWALRPIGEGVAMKIDRNR